MMFRREEVVIFTAETPMPYKVLSSCYQESFEEEGVGVFCSPLQYLQWHKAKLFGDVMAQEKIMQVKHPADLRKVGKSVVPFDESLWNQHKERIALEANLLRFKQNEQSKMILLNTLDKVLIEANAFNYTWACGLSQYDSRILNPEEWTGQNLWGKSLMEAREILKEK